jgi:hypothetical protein
VTPDVCSLVTLVVSPSWGDAMSKHNANDGNGAGGLLAHGASWSDVWAGLLLTLVLFGSAILVAFLFSGRHSSMSREEEPAPSYTEYLLGIRDPARPGWRTTVSPWNLTGIHDIAVDIEDRGQDEAIAEGGRREATIETSVAHVAPRP